MALLFIHMEPSPPYQTANQDFTLFTRPVYPIRFTTQVSYYLNINNKSRRQHYSTNKTIYKRKNMVNVLTYADTLDISTHFSQLQVPSNIVHPHN